MAIKGFQCIGRASDQALLVNLKKEGATFVIVDPEVKGIVSQVWLKVREDVV